jgi:hypothetical protein
MLSLSVPTFPFPLPLADEKCHTVQKEVFVIWAMLLQQLISTFYWENDKISVSSATASDDDGCLSCLQ